MFAVDTNIFLYAHFGDYPQHPKAREFCRQRLFSGDDWCLAWQVCYEYVRIATHPAIHRVPLTFGEALSDLQPYLSWRTCHVLGHTPQHFFTLRSLAELIPGARGNLIHDCHYAALLKEHGVQRIYTADSDFKKFDFLDAIDPTR